MNIDMRENELSLAFREIYDNAKVRSGEALWSKALVLNVLFSPSSKLAEVLPAENDSENKLLEDAYGLKSVNSSRNAVAIVIEDEELVGTPYKKFVFYGYQLNTELHYQFTNYLVCAIQKTYFENFGSVNIDFKTVMSDLNLSPSNMPFFRKTFNEVLNRLFHSSTKIELRDGSVINDRFIYKYTVIGDDVFNIKFGDIFIDAVVKDTYSKKIDYAKRMLIKSGAARLLFDKIEMFAFNGTARVNVNTMFKLLSLDGQRDSKMKVFNSALVALTKAEYVKSVEDVYRGKTLVEKIITIDKSFNIKLLEATDRLGKPEVATIEASFTVPSIQALEAPVVPVIESVIENKDDVLAKQLADIEEFFRNEELKQSEAFVSTTSLDERFSAFKKVPDFEQWKRASAEREGRFRSYSSPRKVWADDAQFNDFN